MKLIIDTREQSIIEYLDVAVAGKPIAYAINQINTGDYIITSDDDLPLACIERKTYKDLTASFRDGRYKNKEKMIHFREQYKCDLFYIIEGTYTTDSIPLANIVAAENHLMITDKFFVIHTENIHATVDRIISLAVSYSRYAPEPKIGGIKLNKDDLCKVIENPDDDMLKCWTTLPGISVVTGKAIAQMTSIRDLTTDVIDAVKTAGGSAINSKAKESLRGVITRNRDIMIKIVAAIRGISAVTAVAIIDAAEANKLDICNPVDVEELKKHVKIKSNQVANLIKFLSYQIPAAATESS